MLLRTVPLPSQDLVAVSLHEVPDDLLQIDLRCNGLRIAYMCRPFAAHENLLLRVLDGGVMPLSRSTHNELCFIFDENPTIPEHRIEVREGPSRLYAEPSTVWVRDPVLVIPYLDDIEAIQYCIDRYGLSLDDEMDLKSAWRRGTPFTATLSTPVTFANGVAYSLWIMYSFFERLKHVA